MNAPAVDAVAGSASPTRRSRASRATRRRATAFDLSDYDKLWRWSIDRPARRSGPTVWESAG